MAGVRLFTIKHAGWLLIASFISHRAANQFLFPTIPLPAYLLVIAVIATATGMAAYGSINRPTKGVRTWFTIVISILLLPSIGFSVVRALITS